MPEAEDKQTKVTIHGGDTWLGQNLRQFEVLQAKLEEMKTRNDALPADFHPSVFLQFIRASVNEIKRLTAMNHALIESLKDHNVANEESKIAFENGRLVEK